MTIKSWLAVVLPVLMVVPAAMISPSFRAGLLTAVTALKSLLE